MRQKLTELDAVRGYIRIIGWLRNVSHVATAIFVAGVISVSTPFLPRQPLVKRLAGDPQIGRGKTLVVTGQP